MDERLEGPVVDDVQLAASDPVLVEPEDVLPLLRLGEEADGDEVPHLQFLQCRVDLCLGEGEPLSDRVECPWALGPEHVEQLEPQAVDSVGELGVFPVGWGPTGEVLGYLEGEPACVQLLQVLHVGSAGDRKHAEGAMDSRHPLREPLPVYLVVARISDLSDLAGLGQLMDPCLDHVEVDPRELLAVEGVGQLTLQPAPDVHEPQQALGVLGDLDLGLVVGVEALPIQLGRQ